MILKLLDSRTQIEEFENSSLLMKLNYRKVHLKIHFLLLKLNYRKVLEYELKILAAIFESEEVAKISSSSISSRNDKQWN
jgi:hypothetical protein